MRYSYIILLVIAFVGCQPPILKSTSAAINKFRDPEIQKIYTLQDERKTTNLLPYLKHQNATYRREAALAFASVQDKTAIPDLINLLMDKEAPVRRTAAYALGQIGDVSAEDALMQYATSEKEAIVKAEILEALGKCASQKGLNFLTNFTPTNEIIKAGLAWGLYRTNAKALQYETAVQKAISLLTSESSSEVRLGAAHFLARTPKLDLIAHQQTIATVAQSDKLPAVRMAAALALGKVNTTQATGTLINLARNDTDYRVRINAIKALTNTDYNQVKAVILNNLDHENINTALAAADFLLVKATPEDATLIMNKANSITNWRVQAMLLAAALKWHPDKNAVRTAIQQRYQQANNIYEKGALLAALSQDADAYDFIEKETFNGASPILASYGIQALAEIRQHKNFPASLTNTFAHIFKRAIASEDAAVIGIAAGVMQKPELNFREAYPDFSFLQTTRDKLVLPRDMETYQELDKTIRYFEGQPAATTPQNPYTHPINWTLVQNLPANQLVQIKTAKGTITLQLMVEEAPGSVDNFVQLAQDGFFNNLNFHRVVPNFVVQGGDPRGDGWGGVDYAIRSEFANLRYLEGYVGMASAGKDTESCQWFITHSPTPHLDGRYTIFAKVTSGMEIVHQLEVGDKIESLILQK